MTFPVRNGLFRSLRWSLSVLSAALLVLGLATQTSARATTSYTFADEFTGAAGSLPSSSWAFQTGGNGWGNGELEQYTNRAVNAHLDGSGHLAIVARKETFTGADGITRGYTSARIFSSAPVSYGYAEARVLLPSG